MTDNRMFSNHVANNQGPIFDALSPHLPKEEGLVLEVSAGSGEHAVFMAPQVPHLTWQPTDVDPAALASIQSWRIETGIENINAPVALNVLDHPWPVAHADAVVNVNLIHVSPWECCLALLKGASDALKTGGILFMYGPYMIDGQHTAPSNQNFDMMLQGRAPGWGVRNLNDVVDEAAKVGLEFVEKIPMPANNFSVVYRKA